MNATATTILQLDESDGRTAASAVGDNPAPCSPIRDEEVVQIAHFRIRECARRLQQLAQVPVSSSLRLELESLSAKLTQLQRRLG